MPFRWLLILACLAGAGCSRRSDIVGFEALETRAVRFPNGREIRAEVKIHSGDMARGMMFRDSVPPGTGMLFIHAKPGRYAYWMYQVRIPLDILWLDGARRIVEISPFTEPCKTKASECPSYGGHVDARYVLELAAGEAQRQGLRLGDNLTF